MFFNQTHICLLIENSHGHVHDLSEERLQKRGISRDYSVRLLTSFLPFTLNAAGKEAWL